MIRPIIHDPLFLAQPSEPATAEDVSVVVDTLKAHLDRCVGMAANMIGVRKRIIVIARGPLVIAMLNPRIIGKSGEYEAEEGCLSLEGTRKARRWRSIRLIWQDMEMQEHTGTLDGFQAQIVQHEVDHCDGILI